MYISVWSGHPHFLLVSFFSTLSLMLFVLIWVVLNCPSLFYFNYACCLFCFCFFILLYIGVSLYLLCRFKVLCSAPWFQPALVVTQRHDPYSDSRYPVSSPSWVEPMVKRFLLSVLPSGELIWSACDFWFECTNPLVPLVLSNSCILYIE